jgi:hypothetical protein
MAAEPMPVIPLEYEHYDDTAARTRLGTRAQRLLIVAWAACAAGWAALVLIETETVVISGPVIALLGVAMTVTGSRAGRRAYAWVGLSHVVICALFVTLVNLLTWSPQEAHLPFAVIGAIHVIATGLPSAWLFLRRQHRPIEARIGCRANDGGEPIHD